MKIHSHEMYGLMQANVGTSKEKDKSTCLVINEYMHTLIEESAIFICTNIVDWLY